jgi:myo-inositol-1(or 4)-monophosphatase
MPIRVSQARTLGEAMLSTGFPYDVATSPDNNVREFGRIVRSAQAVRRAGAASLDVSWVAAGVLDGYWEANLKPWDWAAGALLVEEAGGRVTDYDGAPWRIGMTRLVATNGLLHGELLEVLGEG